MNTSTLLLMAAMLLVFWFLVLRPARQRQKKAQELQNSIGVGDDVMTGSGIFGTVVAEEGDRLQLEIAPGVNVWFLRPAIANKVEPEVPAAPEELELEAAADDAPDQPAPVAGDEASSDAASAEAPAASGASGASGASDSTGGAVK